MKWSTMTKAERREAVATGAADGASASKLARQFDTAIAAIEALAERSGIEFQGTSRRLDDLGSVQDGRKMSTDGQLSGEDREPPRSEFARRGNASENESVTAGRDPQVQSRSETITGQSPSAGRGTRARPLGTGEGSRRSHPAGGGCNVVKADVTGRRDGQRLPRERGTMFIPRIPVVAIPKPRADLDAPISLRVSLLDLRFDQCRYPDGAFLDPVETYCGHVAWVRFVKNEYRTGPWCEYHARLCYTTPAERAASRTTRAA